MNAEKKKKGKSETWDLPVGAWEWHKKRQTLRAMSTGDVVRAAYVHTKAQTRELNAMDVWLREGGGIGAL